MTERRHSGSTPFVELLPDKTGVIVAAQGCKQRMRYQAGLHPQFAVRTQRNPQAQAAHSNIARKAVFVMAILFHRQASPEACPKAGLCWHLGLAVYCTEAQ